MAAKPRRLTLDAETAEDIMTGNPISLPQNADLREAIDLMAERGYTAAPVIDESGRPVGVISVTDILIHNREQARSFKGAALSVAGDASGCSAACVESEVALTDPTTVNSIMTPAVLTVRRDASAREVVRSMMDYQVHHLFVADEDGTLIGVISLGDIVRKLN